MSLMLSRASSSSACSVSVSKSMSLRGTGLAFLLGAVAVRMQTSEGGA
jgi:hypothetical protein